MKISFISLGCDKNLVDSEIMLGLIDREGYEITQNEEEADIIVINSCGFIADANKEAIDNILRVADYKKSGVLKAIIVTGCMAERYKTEIFKQLPEVDAVVGTAAFESIGEVIKALTEGQKRVVKIEDKDKKLDETLPKLRMMTTLGGFAYLKIAEGCDAHCTYCTIPSLRGKYRSRSLESLVEEAQMLADKGVTELILIAQDTTLYGKDIYGESRLHVLIKRLSEIEGIEWIRILYAYPENITDSLIFEMAQNPKVCHYLDMPIQHASDTVLKKMGRRSRKEELKEVINKLRGAMPDICLRTTIIVGFPQETEEEFKELKDFVDEVSFDRLGVFEYSREDGTPAAKMKGQVHHSTKSRRKRELLELQQEISNRVCKSFVGRTLKVIVEGKLSGEDNIYIGRSYRDCYEIDGYVFFRSEKELLSGDYVNVLITSYSDYDLTGEEVNTSPSAV
ncbi:MAG: 30S ribosomal protein S12 methylthiotransferase RimO [Clostridiales bacterium]|nr:30S ribosomal protein S12 methylthiotransferase RimO [Clostridiales bacterium]